MFGLISYGFQLVMDVSLELVIYMFVDVFTKNTLRDTSEVSEKRSIWLCEVAVLTVLAVVVLLLHHTPYVLATLTLLTLAYTQLLERVNFRYWWVNLGTKWEEFQQHEESMGRLNKMNHQQHHAPHPPATHHPHMSPQQQQQQWMANGGRPGWSGPQPLPPHLHQQQQYVQYDTSMRPAPMSEAWYPADKRPSPGGMVVMSEGSSGPGYSFTLSPGGRPMPPRVAPSGPPPGYGRMMPEYMVHPQHQQAPTPGYTYNPPVLLAPRGRELARPPLHPSQSPIRTPPPQPQSIKTRVMSALGMKTQSAVPAGLRNNGENLCFMNSVLQCLAHCPGLARGLGDNQEAPDCSPAQVAVVTAVTELLDTLGKAPSSTATTHTDKVRQAASTLPGTMVTHPKHAGQQQQDAAEFLMWMLDALHTALDVSGKDKQDLDNTGQAANTASMSWITPRYSSGALNMLRFIYGDLTPEKITELKAACRKEIEMAGGVDVRGYAEPLQRLSDLEWLTYKETAQSVIDDMFTGQMVEALHCRACDRLTVDIQTFNILPVPITRPRSLTGLVRLEDCLASFGTVEELYGQEGLQCEGCNKQQTGSPGGEGVTGHEDMWGRGSLGASPILPNGVTRIRLGGDTVLRRRKLGSDSAIYSPSSSHHHQIAAMSPIDTGRGGDMMLNDSGFQDNNHRTSTPISAGVAAVKLTEGQRRSLLRQTPECLILQLLRFTYAGGQPIKLHQPVILPLTGLDLTPQIVDTVIQRADLASSSSQTGAASSHRYDLCGLCLHLGSDVTASGHYVSYGRLPEGGDWYRYDDDTVVAVNMDYELSTRQVRENAYLAFYRRSSHS